MHKPHLTASCDSASLSDRHPTLRTLRGRGDSAKLRRGCRRARRGGEQRLVDPGVGGELRVEGRGQHLPLPDPHRPAVHTREHLDLGAGPAQPRRADEHAAQLGERGSPRRRRTSRPGCRRRCGPPSRRAARGCAPGGTPPPGPAGSPPRRCRASAARCGERRERLVQGDPREALEKVVLSPPGRISAPRPASSRASGRHRRPPARHDGGACASTSPWMARIPTPQAALLDRSPAPVCQPLVLGELPHLDARHRAGQPAARRQHFCGVVPVRGGAHDRVRAARPDPRS